MYHSLNFIATNPNAMTAITMSTNISKAPEIKLVAVDVKLVAVDVTSNRWKVNIEHRVHIKDISSLLFQTHFLFGG
jgi:hypothetical protein